MFRTLIFHDYLSVLRCQLLLTGGKKKWCSASAVQCSAQAPELASSLAAALYWSIGGGLAPPPFDLTAWNVVKCGGPLLAWSQEGVGGTRKGKGVTVGSPGGD